MTTYGYIGLGMMGAAMANNLCGSHDDVVVFDINAEAVSKAVDRGATAATTAAELARLCDVVSICVPEASHIDAVMTGPGGIAEGAHKGLSLLIHSTVHPDTMTANQAIAATWGVPLFDACVAGGAERAENGTQVVLVGGMDEMAPEVIDLINIYGELIINAGPVGAGASLKLAINIMTFAQFTAAASAYDLVVATGADPAALLDAWRGTGMLGQITENFSMLLGLPPESVVGEFRTMMETQTAIAQKDLSLAMSLGQSRRGTAEFMQAVHDAMPAVYNLTEESP